jgi:hypothetical protein
MLTENDVKQIFFYCNNDDPNGLYIDLQDNVLDVVEFAHKLEAVITANVRSAEHARLVKIAKSINANVARVLEEKKL